METGVPTQDTIKPQIVVRINTDKLLPDSVFTILDKKPDHIINAELNRNKKSVIIIPDTGPIADTTSVCARNSIADVSFCDSLNFIKDLRNHQGNQVPFWFADNNRSDIPEYKPSLVMDLKTGFTLPERPIQSDWIIVVMFFLVFLHLLVRSKRISMVNEITRFFLFRGINESSSHDISSLFTWQSTIQNLLAFFITGLFAYCVADWYDILPAGFNPMLSICIASGVIVVLVNIRHFMCLAVGNLSGQTDTFNEYIVTIYHSYRISSLVIFIIILLLVYSTHIPPQLCIISGFTVLGIFYLYRILRLLFIFIKRGVSISYLILYLCALEILPVLILVKYLAGTA